MSDARISQGDIVESGAYQEVVDLTTRVQELAASFRELKSAASSFEVKIDGASGIKELTVILKDMAASAKGIQDLKRNISSLTSDLAKLAKSQSDAAIAANKAAVEDEKLATQRQKTRQETAKAEEIERRNTEAKEKSAKATADQEAAERSKIEAQKQANAEAQQQAANFQREAQALYTSIKAHQDAAASFREEAQQKSLAAKQSTDAAEKSLFEAQAKQALAAALREEKAIKAELAAANKQVAATVRDNIAAEALLTRELDRLNAASQRTVQEANRQSNAYEQLKREYNEAAYATKTLAAEFVIAQREGKKTTQELERMRQALQAQQNATLAQSNALLQMEQAVGQNQRAVGAYANATGEITQILRELPNFAISAQTGILSLSNNLPMLTASLQRLAQTVDINTGRAIGWRGVLRSLGSTIFSLQGLIVLVTMLIVAYHKEIGEAISRTTSAEKAQKLYNKALEESATHTGEEIAQLLKIQRVLSSATAEREQVLEAMEAVNRLYPGLFNNLTEENRLTSEVNASIEEQIALIKMKAEVQAGEKAIAEAAGETLKAQQALNKELGGFQKFWGDIKFSYKQASGGVVELSEKNKKLLESQKQLLDIGAISSFEYNTRYLQLLKLNKAEETLTETVKLAIDPESQRISLAEKKIKAIRDEINEVKKSDAAYGINKDGSVKWIAQKEKEIDAIQKVIDKLQEERDARINAKPPVPQKTFLEIAIQETETKLKLAKDGSREELALKEKLASYLYAREIGALKKRYADDYKLRGADLEANAQYVRDKEQLYSDLFDNIEKMGVKFDKANKPKRTPRGFDPTNAELKGQEDLNAAINDFAKQRVETEMAANKAIFDDETISLQKRLDAYAEYVKGQQQLNVIEENGELNAVQDKLNKIREVEAIAESKRSSAQKSLLLDKEALLIREQTMLEKYRLRADEINSAAQKKEREIIESSTKYLIQQQNARYAALRDETNKETALRLSGLDEMRQKGEISEKSFWRMRQTVISSESKILFDKELQLLQDYKRRIINDPLVPDAVKENVSKLMGDLEKMRPEPKITESKSILEYLGFKSSANDEVEAAADTVARFQTEIDKATIQMAQAKEARLFEEEQAAQQFDISSQEYADAVVAAAQREAEAILQGDAIRATATKNHEEAMKNLAEAQRKIANSYKEKISQQIQELLGSVFKAIDDSRNNYFTERFNQLDEEAQKITDNAEQQKLAAEQTIINEEEKAKRLKAIEDEKVANERRIDNQRKALKRQQAVREKQDAIFQAGMNGGIAIAKALASINPSMGPTGIALAKVSAALIAIQTAATIAALAARPIPEYWKGTPSQGHPFDGPAIVGERGTELGVRPGGGMFLTPNKTTKMFLEKGTHIIPADKLASVAQRSAMAEMGMAQTAVTPEKYAEALYNHFKNGMTEHTEKIVEAIGNIPIPHYRMKNGEWVKSMQVGNSWTEYVDSI